MVSLMTALWFAHLEAPDRVSVKPHASPVLHAINFLLGRLDPGYLPRLREYGGLQSYPSRTQGPRPRRLLDRQRRHRRHRDDLGRAGAPLRRRALRRPARRAPDRAAGRRRARRGRGVGGDRRPDGRARWARCCGSSTSTASRWTAWCPTSPPGAWSGCSRRPAGTPRRSSTAGACARSSSATAARRCAPASTRWATRSTSACCAPTTTQLRERLPGGEQAHRAACIADLGPRELLAAFRDLGGHDLEALLAAYRATDAVRDRPSVVFAYTIKGWSLPTEGHPVQPLGAAHRRAVRRPRPAARHRRRSDPWRAFDPDSRRGPAVRRRVAARLEREPVERHEPPPVPAELGRHAHRARAPPSRRSGACSSTSPTTRPRSPRTWSPSRPTWRRRPTSAAGSTAAASGASASASTGSPTTPTRWCAGASPTTGATSSSASPRSTSSDCWASSGRRGAATGRPLLPVGTIYDPFVTRAHEPWSFGIYAGGQSILVGHAVGHHAGARGRRAPVGRHAVGRDRAAGLRGVGAGLHPGLRVVVPARARRAGPRGRQLGLLPPVDATDRPGARGGAAEGAARERAPRRRAGRRLPPARGRARDHRRRWAPSSPRRSRRPTSSTPRSCA